MMRVKSIERFNTSFGLAFVLNTTETLKIGQKIEIDNAVYEVKRISMKSNPSTDNLITVFV